MPTPDEVREHVAPGASSIALDSAGSSAIFFVRSRASAGPHVSGLVGVWGGSREVPRAASPTTPALVSRAPWDASGVGAIAHIKLTCCRSAVRTRVSKTHAVTPVTRQGPCCSARRWVIGARPSHRPPYERVLGSRPWPAAAGGGRRGSGGCGAGRTRRPPGAPSGAPVSRAGPMPPYATSAGRTGGAGPVFWVPAGRDPVKGAGGPPRNGERAPGFRGPFSCCGPDGI